MPKKGKKKRGGSQALPVGMAPPSAPGTSQQTSHPGAGRQQQTPSTEEREFPALGQAVGGNVWARPRTTPDEGQQAQIQRPMSSLSLADSPTASEVGTKPKWRAVSPERAGFELRVARTAPLPKKPGYNRLGRPIRLISNCYPLKIPSGNIYHYDVEIYTAARKSKTTVEKKISPDQKKNKCLNTKCNRRVFDRMVNENPDFKGILPVYDGRKNMYTRRPLRFLTETYSRKVFLPDSNSPNSEGADFFVYIKPVKKKGTDDNAISLDPLHALFSGQVTEVPREVFMAIETVLKHSPCMRLVPLGLSFFYPPKYPTPLGSCKEIWSGYHQSVRLGTRAPMVNIDVSASAFYRKGSLLNYLASLMDCDVEGLRRVTSVPAQVLRIMNDMVRNLQVEVIHMTSYRRKYRVGKITDESASRLRFEMDVEGRGKVSYIVAQYFAERYRYNLKFPNLPCVKVLNKNSLLPIEVCEVVEGQRYSGTLKGEETAKMVQDTSYLPKDRFNKINMITQKEARFSQDPYLREFNFSVSTEPLRLEGRQLETPAITYHTPSRDSNVRPEKGTWNMRGKKFRMGATVSSWALVSFSDVPQPVLRNFSQDLSKFANIHGLNMGQCRDISLERAPRNVEHFDNYISTVFQKLKRNHLVKLVVFVNQSEGRSQGGEDPSKALYRTAKDVASKMDIVSQCVKPENVRRANPSLICNILLKINAKMGGTNCSLSSGEIPGFMRERIMFCGADVTHPSPTGDIPCSIAAVVGSKDDSISLFEVATRAQVNEDDSKASREVIADMEGMMIELLTAYRNHRGTLPVRIVVYRDGVSDGEFPEVGAKEVSKIRSACKAISKNTDIKLTYIVMQKRHHVRTMCEEYAGPAANKLNPPPGTLIDNVITHPHNYDFFLYPHYGLQGTSRPAYHTVVNDDNGISVSDMHNMTYSLSYIYARCTKSISSPAPARYAHLAAFTARQRLLKHKNQAQSDKKGPYDPNAPKLNRAELNTLSTSVIKVKFEDIV